MKRFSVAVSLLLAFGLGVLVSKPHTEPVQAATAMPSSGWTLHIDAKRHFGSAHPNEIAHHYCKAVASMLECQIYDSDAPNARLIAVETIVQPNVYKSFSPSEQALWHWHKTEVPKVDATMPGMPPAQAKKIVASILPTYGKVWVLFDPVSTNNMPIGKPWVSVLK
ncbi:MAG TPA: DUF1264 domain-containing protein [Candidatus Baltobacteraceae bacterium]|nr:DUF1264 domain-containing protein [Candidatus Baltobacteraceae bacterium]